MYDFMLFSIDEGAILAMKVTTTAREIEHEMTFEPEVDVDGSPAVGDLILKKITADDVLENQLDLLEGIFNCGNGWKR